MEGYWELTQRVGRWAWLTIKRARVTQVSILDYTSCVVNCVVDAGQSSSSDRLVRISQEPIKIKKQQEVKDESMMLRGAIWPKDPQMRVSRSRGQDLMRGKCTGRLGWLWLLAPLCLCSALPAAGAASIADCTVLGSSACTGPSGLPIREQCALTTCGGGCGGPANGGRAAFNSSCADGHGGRARKVRDWPSQDGVSATGVSVSGGLLLRGDMDFWWWAACFFFWPLWIVIWVVLNLVTWVSRVAECTGKPKTKNRKILKPKKSPWRWRGIAHVAVEARWCGAARKPGARRAAKTRAAQFGLCGQRRGGNGPCVYRTGLFLWQPHGWGSGELRSGDTAGMDLSFLEGRVGPHTEEAPGGRRDQ